ncbi:unnamed protein product [Cuscuta campestris]|uniref:GH16 domain-containing protein n=1 Tax=Cuscuta campestris TaxID=132261 RepID=A0A484MI71_9ASTE|nr:unnamed protein product [Cuscuta campestris]
MGNRQISFNVLYGAQNVHMKNNGSTVDLILDKSSGCGLASKERYYYGFFNAAIKLPAGFTSGVVVAFYVPSGQYTGERGDKQKASCTDE